MKRAILLVALAAAVTACDRGSAPGPPARVGDWALPGDRLADLLVLGQPLPLDSVTVDALVQQWVSMAALAQRAAAGVDLLGDEAREASLWLERREVLVEAERRVRLGSDTLLPRARAEAVFRADTLRLLAHVLRRAGPGTSPRERDLQRRTAQSILDGLLAGGSWSQAVAQSEDAETKEASGLLGLLRPEEVPAPLRAAAAGLRPGQVSSVVESSLGFHVLYRPSWEEVAALYTRLLAKRLAQAADSVAGLDLVESRHVQVTPGAATRLRALAAAPGWTDAAGDAVETSRPDEEAMAIWEGGRLTAPVAGRYVAALPDDARTRLARADDVAAADFLRQVSVREIRVADAERAGIVPDAETLAALERTHREDVRRLRAALEGGGNDPWTPEAVDRYMESVVARQVAFEPLPPLLRAWLLAPLPWSVDEEAVRAASKRARDLLAASGGGAERSR